MKVYTAEIYIKTKGKYDIIDITGMVEEEVGKSGIKDGIVNIFLPGSTGGISSIEYEPGLRKDLKGLMDRLAPPDEYYYHHETWGDDNGSSHLLSAIFKPFYTVPVVNGRLVHGTWQQIVFLEFDTRPRNRKLIIQILGE